MPATARDLNEAEDIVHQYWESSLSYKDLIDNNEAIFLVAHVQYDPKPEERVAGMEIMRIVEWNNTGYLLEPSKDIAIFFSLACDGPRVSISTI